VAWQMAHTSMTPGRRTPTSSLLMNVWCLPIRIWAVGAWRTSSWQTLVERWNGSQWSVVTSPNSGTGENLLYGVSAPSVDLSWAVGIWRDQAGVGRTLIQRWNSMGWSVAPSPTGSTGLNQLLGVSATPSVAVAVGERYGSNSVRTLVEYACGS
jgi:hypothetical protein